MIRLKQGKRTVELPNVTAKPQVPKRVVPQRSAGVPIAEVAATSTGWDVPWLFVGPLALGLLALGASALPRRALASSTMLRLIEPRRLDLAISAFIVVGSVLIALVVTRGG